LITADSLTEPPSAAVPGLLRTLAKDRRFVLGATLLCVMVLFALAQPLFGDPLKIYHDGLDDKGLPLGLGAPGHILGTDTIGRDQLTRLSAGTRTTLEITVLAAAISFLVGLVIGLTAGMYRTRSAALLLRVTDVFLAIPTVVLGLALASIVGQGVLGIVVVVTMLFWAWTARLVHGEVLSVRGRAYIEAAEVMGERRTRIMFRHVVPAMGSMLWSIAALNAAGVVGVGSALSYLGAGVQPPKADLGGMLQQNQGSLAYAPRLILLPLACIVITVMGLTLIGQAFQGRTGVRRRVRWFGD
jgi:peptide/nickel transport system permease protein